MSVVCIETIVNITSNGFHINNQELLAKTFYVAG